MSLVVVNEAGHSWGEVFLQEWVPAAAEELIRLIGGHWTDSIPIVLSRSARHSERFPPNLNEHEDLVGEDEVQDCSSGDYVGTSWWTYAHGVCTIASALQVPPAVVVVGLPVIYLDIERIEGIADEVR